MTAKILQFPEPEALRATHRTMHQALVRNGFFQRELEEAVAQAGHAVDSLLEAAHGHRPAACLEEALPALKAALFHTICLNGTQAGEDRALFAALASDVRRA